MSGFDPQAFSDQFSRTFNGGDVDGLVAMYAPDAVYVVRPDKVVSGAALRKALSDLLAFKPHIEADLQSCVTAADTALLIQTWSLSIPRNDGGPPVRRSGTGTDILKRAESGEWKILIDNPLGTALPPVKSGS